MYTNSVNVTNLSELKWAFLYAYEKAKILQNEVLAFPHVMKLAIVQYARIKVLKKSIKKITFN